ncbi:sugar ABC transporter permease [Anaeromyxobacter oryzae]|uniref:Xylose transport system permease protein XylH n=1 Tax=Anaeromyxobacter oryzae TaxID=2918170 RepID=A0ABM7WP15_9BACT|nr:sugar ABC transporter permease [Anaeromyxobacter oryzae]BDG01198.1 xylose ABC transporter permease [Anaeromyxobacter oryzae]
MATTMVQAPAGTREGKLRDLLVGSVKHNTKQYTMALALVAIWVIFALLTDGVFITARNLSNLFVQTVTTAILAIGMVLVIVAGHIDLSVGSVLGFTGAVCAMFMIQREWGVAPAIAATLISGLLIGAWHGFWIAYRKVPAFIVTLASMLAFRGLIIGITGGQTQGLEMAPEAAAERFKLIGQGYIPTFRAAAEGQLHDTSLLGLAAVIAIFVVWSFRKRAARRRFGFPVLPAWAEGVKLAFVSAIIALFGLIMVIYLGIPWSIVLLLALAVVFNFIANDTTFGRHLYAIGGNPDAARLSGINVARNTFMLFMVMGVMTAVAGIVYTSRLNAATTSAGQNAELDAIAAAVIGGTSLLGGEGTIFGALVGALVMASLDNGMSLMNLDITFQYVIKGLILLLAVWVDMAQRKK